MSFTFMKRPGPPQQSTPTTHRAPTTARAPAHTTHPAYSHAYIYLRRLLRGRAPAEVSEAEIRTTEEYRSYMDHNLVWQWELHVTEAEAIAACRLILEDLAAGRHVSWPGDARNYILSVRTIAGMKAATPPTPSLFIESMRDVRTAPGPVPEPVPPGPGPGPKPEPGPPGPEPPGPQPPERRIVTPTIEPPKKERNRDWFEDAQRRVEAAEKWLEDLRKDNSEKVKVVEWHVKQAGRLIGIAAGFFALTGGQLYKKLGEEFARLVFDELDRELDELQRLHVEDEPDFPDKLRLPEEGPGKGFWGGTRGHSEWFSENPDVNAVTNYEPVPYVNGEPDFSKWAEEKVILKEITGDNDKDFAAADRVLARRRGWLSKSGEPIQARAEAYRRENELTWHHAGDEEMMQLVPRKLHKNVPHFGGASKARAGAGE